LMFAALEQHTQFLSNIRIAIDNADQPIGGCRGS